MAFVFGMLSVGQVVALPGLVVLAAIRFRAPLANIATAVFSLSYAFNYGIVTLLVACGWYTRETLLAVIAAELIALWLLRSRISVASRGVDGIGSQPLLIASLVAAFAGIAWAITRWSESLGTAFVTWDAIYSWNRWAKVFAGGAMPADVQYYPQLIPANWSMTYVLMKTASFEMFPKGPMGLFFILTLLGITVAGIEMRNAGVVLGAPLTALLARKCLGPFLNDGYVDVCVAFFAVAAVTLLLISRDDDVSALWVSCAAAAAAALTKQAGVWLMLVWPILAVTLRRVKFRAVVVPWTACAIAPVVFYVAQYFAIRRGTNYSNIAYVTHDIYRGATVSQRAFTAFRALGIYTAVIVFTAAALPLLPRFARVLVLTIALPFTVIWACYFSYDYRNLALALPFIGIAAGSGAVEIAERALAIVQRRR